MRFVATELSKQERALQVEVRAFLAEELPRPTFTPSLNMYVQKDPDFSGKLAKRGWLGMAIPKRYGGHDRSAVDRLIVVEELLRWGAPVGHHWIADRQTAPLIAKFGTEEQRERFLPSICAGKLSFSIGMSEPDAGSDLASVRTKAVPDGDGWLLNGRKIWTTGAHHNDWIVVLCRTASASEAGDKHGGLSQLLVDLRSPGVEVHPIPFIDGSVDFNEVAFNDVFVPHDLLLGELGQGWAQNTSELAYERGGPDRWLSSYLVVEELLRMHEGGGDAAPEILEVLGDVVAHYSVFHNLSLSVARLIDAGEPASIESALVKEMATRFEQDVVAAVVELVEFEPNMMHSTFFEQLLAHAVLIAPSFTIRGGTNEILRGVAAKGLRPSERTP